MLGWPGVRRPAFLASSEAICFTICCVSGAEQLSCSPQAVSNVVAMNTAQINSEWRGKLVTGSPISVGYRSLADREPKDVA